MQRLSEAEIAFNRALAIDPAHAPAHFGLAQASLLRDDSATAMRHLLDAVRLDPDNSEYQAALRELGGTGGL
jgi:tetratricopeptide (TPR) repeat protein